MTVEDFVTFRTKLEAEAAKLEARVKKLEDRVEAARIKIKLPHPDELRPAVSQDVFAGNIIYYEGAGKWF